MNTPNDIKTLLSGYNSKYKMSKCLETSTLIENNQLTCNLREVNFSNLVSDQVVDALASIGLLSLAENDLSGLAVETRLNSIVAGRFATRRGGEGKTPASPKLPETLAQLPLSTIEAAVGDNLTTVKLSVKQLAKFGLLESLSTEVKLSLEEGINTQRENTERTKILFELFRISKATVESDTAAKIMFTCQVPVTLWNSVFTKVKSSSDHGWGVVADSVSLDESMTGMVFTLFCVKSQH